MSRSVKKVSLLKILEYQASFFLTTDIKMISLVVPTASILCLQDLQVRHLTHLAYPLQCVQFPHYGRHALREAGLEEDAEDSAREVWDQGELVEKSATQEKTPAALDPTHVFCRLLRMLRCSSVRGITQTHCSGLSRGLAFSLSFEVLMCFSILSSSSCCALCGRDTRD